MTENKPIQNDISALFIEFSIGLWDHLSTNMQHCKEWLESYEIFKFLEMGQNLHTNMEPGRVSHMRIAIYVLCEWIKARSVWCCVHACMRMYVCVCDASVSVGDNFSVVYCMHVVAITMHITCTSHIATQTPYTDTHLYGI